MHGGPEDPGPWSPNNNIANKTQQIISGIFLYCNKWYHIYDMRFQSKKEEHFAQQQLLVILFSRYCTRILYIRYTANTDLYSSASSS